LCLYTQLTETWSRSATWVAVRYTDVTGDPRQGRWEGSTMKDSDWLMS
jgi:hypothetical protein